jgi:peptidoglycan/LPS O-acetylase OafA/YrhL
VIGFGVGSAIYTSVNGAWLRSLGRRLATALEVAVIAELAALFWIIPIVQDNALSLLASPVVFGQMVAVFSMERGLISKLLKRGLPRRAGTLSYSIYMNHVLIISVLKVALDAIGRVSGFHPGSLLGTALALLFLLIVWRVSQWTFENIERPGQTLAGWWMSARHEKRLPD